LINTVVYAADDVTLLTNTGRPSRQCNVQAPLSTLTPKRRKSHSPTVEDIYLNRLWKTQMPKERLWESIPENPVTDPRTGSEKVFTRKVRCAMKFEDAPNVTRLRQRRAKAVAHGWKPPTKKRLAVLDSLLESKLANVDPDDLTTSQVGPRIKSLQL